MATVTMDRLLEEMDKQELSKNDAGTYISGSVTYGQAIKRVATQKRPRKPEACAIGEACLQLAKMAECPPLLDPGLNSGFHLHEILAKCVEGTTEVFWAEVDGLHHHSIMAGMTRAQHIRLCWEHREELESIDYTDYPKIWQ